MPRKRVDTVSSSVPDDVTTSKRQALRLTVDRYLPGRRCSELLVCGEGDFGQLGLGEDRTSASKFTRVKFETDFKKTMVCAGGAHAVVLSEHGGVYTCGSNDEGALGRRCFDEDGAECEDDTDARFRRVEFNDKDIAKHGKVCMVSAGGSHCAALTERGSVFLWGTFRSCDGLYGLVFDPTTGEMIKKVCRPRLLVDHKEHTIVKIASGEDHLAMLDSRGTVWTCGAANAGQLGRIPINGFDGRGSLRIAKRWLIPEKLNHLERGRYVQFKDVFCTTYGGFAVTTNDVVYCWGLNNYGQMGVAMKPEGIMSDPFPKRSDCLTNKHLVQFDGDHHVLAVSVDGILYGLGRGLDGRLGLGRCLDVEAEPVVINVGSSKVVGCCAAGSCGFAWTEDGRALSWGVNETGVLGLPEESDVVQTPREIGLSAQYDVGTMDTNGIFSMMLADKRNAS